MAASQSYCFACFNDQLSLVNGVLVCDACGTQSEIPIEEEEFGEGGGAGRAGGFRRRMVNPSATPAPTPQLQQDKLADVEAEQAQVQGQALNYAKCLQAMLQAQSEVLLTQLELPVDVSTLIRHLWLSYLPHTGLLDIKLDQVAKTNAAMDREARDKKQRQKQPGVEEGGQGGNGSAGLAAGDDGANGEGDVAGVTEEEATQSKLLEGEATQDSRVAVAFKRVLHNHTSLVICYLACLCMRQAVTPMDVCRWAVQGRLPYLDMPNRCQRLLASMPEALRPPLQLISPSGAPEAAVLMRSALQMADTLRLTLPNINGELLLLKCCKELRAPEGIFHVARELYLMYFADSPLMNISSITRTASPYLTVAVLVCMALKMGYGIGSEGRQGSRLPGLPDPPSSWVDWAEACMQSAACKPLQMPVTTEEAQQLRGGALLQYLSFCQEKVFSGGSCPAGLLDMQRVLQQQLDEQQQQQQAQQQQQKLAGSKGRKRKQLAGEVAIPGGQQQQQQQQAGQETAHHKKTKKRVRWKEADLNVNPRAAGPAVAVQAQPGTAGGTIPAEEVGPSIRRHIYTYAAFTRLIRSSQSHVDIVALVAVAAAYVNASPVLVMQSLAALEQNMVRVDKGYKAQRRELHAALGGALFAPAPA